MPELMLRALTASYGSDIYRCRLFPMWHSQSVSKSLLPLLAPAQTRVQSVHGLGNSNGITRQNPFCVPLRQHLISQAIRRLAGETLHCSHRKITPCALLHCSFALSAPGGVACPAHVCLSG